MPRLGPLEITVGGSPATSASSPCDTRAVRAPQDPSGAGRDGVGRDGREPDGFDPDGFDPNGFDPDGFDQAGPAPAPPPARTVRTAVARVVSEVFQPPFTVGAMLLVSPAAGRGWPGTWWYGAVAALFTCVLPFVILLVLVRTGRVGDHHVSERSERAPVLVMSLACIAAGLALLTALGAPAPVLTMTLALIAGVAILALVSLRWKISGHATSASAAAVSVLVLLGLQWWPILVLVPLVGWARVTLGAHTIGPVLAGMAVGPLVIAGLWRLLMTAA